MQIVMTLQIISVFTRLLLFFLFFWMQVRREFQGLHCWNSLEKIRVLGQLLSNGNKKNFFYLKKPTVLLCPIAKTKIVLTMIY